MSKLLLMQSASRRRPSPSATTKEHYLRPILHMTNLCRPMSNGMMDGVPIDE